MRSRVIVIDRSSLVIFRSGLLLCRYLVGSSTIQVVVRITEDISVTQFRGEILYSLSVDDLSKTMVFEKSEFEMFNDILELKN